MWHQLKKSQQQQQSEFTGNKTKLKYPQASKVLSTVDHGFIRFICSFIRAISICCSFRTLEHAKKNMNLCYTYLSIHLHTSSLLISFYFIFVFHCVALFTYILDFRLRFIIILVAQNSNTEQTKYSHRYPEEPQKIIRCIKLIEKKSVVVFSAKKEK